MSHDRDWDRRSEPIADPPQRSREREYEHPFRPDQWDQLPSAPFRPQGRPPRPEAQADGYPGRSESEGRAGAWRGPHAGKGPKGYRRSDERIRETVSERLARHGELDASEIEVAVRDGEVTFEGSVPDRDSKRLAEDLAHDLPGVREVHNHLRVERRSDH
jgi:hypothetical protein